MRKYLFALIVGFIFIMIPTQNVFADTSGVYTLDRSKLIYYNLSDASDYYEGNEISLLTNTTTPSMWYTWNYFSFQNIVTTNNKVYSPSFYKLYSQNNMPICSDKCDVNISFEYAFYYNHSQTSSHGQTALLYQDRFRNVSTGFSGIKLVGKDYNDNDKYFYCTGTYLLQSSTADSTTWSKYIATCPTSNFKRIDYILISTGWRTIDTSEQFYLYLYNNKLNFSTGAYTGTQDGVGGSVSESGNQNITDVYDAMTDDNIDTTFQNSTMNDINSQLATNSVISDLLLLPVRMYQSILNSLGSNTCVAFNLGSLYGTNLTLPCIQVQDYIGSTLWTTIDLIFCGIFILVIRKKFVDIFNNMTNLKNGGNELE